METPPISEVLPNPCGYARGLLPSIARYPDHDAKVRKTSNSSKSCTKNYSFCIKKHNITSNKEISGNIRLASIIHSPFVFYMPLYIIWFNKSTEIRKIFNV